MSLGEKQPKVCMTGSGTEVMKIVADDISLGAVA
jgi:hypothetical protein